MLFGFLLAIYHFGLEQNLWNNVFSCDGTLNFEDISTEELLNNLNNTPIVNCETITWSFLKLSLTGWNMILTLVILIIWGVYTSSRKKL